MAKKHAAKTAGNGRGKKDGKGTKAQVPEAQAEARTIVAPSVITNMVKLSDRTRSQIQEATGTLGQALRDAQERGLNLKAFRMADSLRKVCKNDPVKARLQWEDFLYYVEVMELKDKMATLFSDKGGKGGKGKNVQSLAEARAQRETESDDQDAFEEDPPRAAKDDERPTAH